MQHLYSARVLLHALFNTCAHVKNPEQWQPYMIIWAYELIKTLHLLIVVGSTALASAVTYQGKATWISQVGQ